MNRIHTAGAAALMLLLGACSSTPPANTAAPGSKTTFATSANPAGPAATSSTLTVTRVPVSGPWQQQIATVLADPALDGGQVSLTVRDATSGRVLFERNPDLRGMPASSMKVVTSAAAMAVLGSDYRFATQLASTGPLQGGQLQGNLYLRGTGDPTMTLQDYRDLAAELARNGVRVVRGDLMLDDTWFDTQRLGQDWDPEDENEPFAAQISALNIALDDHYNVGSVLLTATGRRGAAPTVSIEPANGYLQVALRGGNGFKVERAHGTNRVEVTGRLKPGVVSQRWVTVSEPTGLVGDVFRRALRDQGIIVQGQTRLGVVTPPGAHVLVDHRSMPLAEMIRPLLKQSNNGIAEVLLKSMGRQTAQRGTAEAGAAAVSAFLVRQGVNPAELQQFDGSGLSRRNLVSSQLFTDVLLAARRQPWFPVWYAALPIAGTGERETGGTLRNRLRDTTAQNNLHAKTGSMGSVSSLTGYVTNGQGQLLVFSMVSNNFAASEGRVKRLEDQVVRALLVSGQ